MSETGSKSSVSSESENTVMCSTGDKKAGITVEGTVEREASGRLSSVAFVGKTTDGPASKSFAAGPNQRNMWFFLEPLDTKLWLVSAGSFILTGFVVWVIEHPANEDFQGETLSSNWSKFMVIVWLFVVLMLTSSYTATLSSLLTVQQIQSASGRDNI
ncbi:hypothetical protein RJ640_025318 [Escallonia rubra]|uniref:Ionotropic glutamate receptor C-terminal domain-containing protein n=1 Tax=Escallonia rubra TaxID=112253 RepID=A0AA88Q8W1_9ASTE|nr:hypothetical protein RJ640_025318 [Escallonia rubra]